MGEIYTVPISHGEGRFLADEALIRSSAANGQIATQYVDLARQMPRGDVQFNPNGSALRGRGHYLSQTAACSARWATPSARAAGLYKNVPGDFDMGLFASAVEYFK